MKYNEAEKLWAAATDCEDQGDLQGAIRLYNEAVSAGSIDAMINLATIYDDKIDPPRRDEAVILYKQAVDRGSSIAAWNLAMHYENNEDTKAAIAWMERAATLGDEDAIALLAKGYAGQGGRSA